MNEKRSSTIDRIFGVGNSLNLDSEIIHLSVCILDKYMIGIQWNVPNIEIIYICCVCIAIKFYSDFSRTSYKILSKYISQYSPIDCFVETEKIILEKIKYIIPTVTPGYYILDFIRCLDLTRQKNRDLRFTMMYLTDYLLFFPELYYNVSTITLIVGILLVSTINNKKKKQVFNSISDKLETPRYPGISSFYRIRKKVLTSARYIGLWMFN